ncbi:MAG: hypothetical protein WB796_19725 [Candidatus Sulfotelmatobacter sp.]
MHGGAGDAGRVEVIEDGHIGVCRAELFYPLVEGVQEILYTRDFGRAVREGSEE